MNWISDLGGSSIATTRLNTLQVTLLLFLGALICFALISEGTAALKGFVELQLHPARLINDFFEIAGVGATLLNGAIVGLIGLVLIQLSGITVSGPTYAAVLTMTGFGFFGKTPLNILPILAGVYIAARLMKKPFSSYLIIALFGTALGPLVSFLAWEIGLAWIPALLIGGVGGLVIGFLLPALAVSMLHLHQGYNLYNMGLTCGFLGLFAFALLKGFGAEFAGTLHWYEGSAAGALYTVPVLSLALLVSGALLGGKGVLKELIAIQGISGRLPSDFTDMASVPASMINSGLVGLAGALYVFLVGAPFSGPVVGGLLTIMGFGAFGTHPKNSWPVLAGVVTATLLTGNQLSAPGPILAAIFGTTLGPLAGQFGILTGFIAGFIHLLMVLQTGAWNGGMNLYNNGFAGGLTATLIVSLIQWYNANRDQ